MAEDRYVQVGLQGATREAMEGWAKICKIKFNKNTSDLDLAEKVHKFAMSCDDATWGSLGIECNNWANAVQEKINEIPDAASEAPAPPAPPAPVAKKAAAAAAPPVEAPPVEAPAPTAEELINACTTKKAIVEKAAELGSPLKIVMSWKLADMKAAVLASMVAAAPAEAPPAPPAEAPPAPPVEAPPAPARTPADPNAKEPSAAAIQRAKATAKTTAETAKKKSAAQPKVPGEPFRQGTTAFLVWDTVRQAGEALTFKEISEKYMAAFNAQTEIKSSNPAGRVTAVLSHMKADKMVLPGKVEGTWIFNPEYKAE